MAADKAFVSCETDRRRVRRGSLHTLRISRIFTDGVIEAPGGAAFTSCVPDYDRDEAFQTEYAKAAADPDAWDAFAKKYVEAR